MGHIKQIEGIDSTHRPRHTTTTNVIACCCITSSTYRKGFFFIYLSKKFFSPSSLLQSNLPVSNKSESEREEREREKGIIMTGLPSAQNSPSSLFFLILFYLLLLPSRKPIICRLTKPASSFCLVFFFISFSFHECAQSKQKAEEEEKKNTRT